MAAVDGGSIEKLESLVCNAERTIDELQDALKAYKVVLEMLRAGANIHDSLAAGDVAETRNRITTVLGQLERARKAARVALMQAELDSGATTKAVAKTWGVSRQLVNRDIQGSSADK